MQDVIVKKTPTFLDAPYRPIHYMGNKSRLLHEICNAVTSGPFKVDWVADPFAGTGVVARALADQMSVVAGDVQEYSCVLARAMSGGPVPEDPIRDHLALAQQHRARMREAIGALLSAEDCANEAEIAAMIEGGSLQDPRVVSSRLAELKGQVDQAGLGAICRYYGGVYFSYAQAVDLDAWRLAAEAAPEPARSLLIAASLRAASDCGVSVGAHFAQPVSVRGATGKPKLRAIAKARSQLQFDAWARMVGALTDLQRIPRSNFPVVARRASFEELTGMAPQLFHGKGVIYADPPYTRDHYSRFYHVLETLARNDEPGLAAGRDGQIVKGLYRLERHQSPFSIKSQAAGAFAELVKLSAQVATRIVISYSPHSAGTVARPETRVMQLQDIADLVQVEYSKVSVAPTGAYRHSKFNRSELNAVADDYAEVLIVGQR